MKKTSLLLLSTTTVYRGCRVVVPDTIKNLHAPKCNMCKHFIPGDLGQMIFASDPHTFSKCKKFGEANLISGIVNHDYADYCRSVESKCGQNGARYEFDEFYKAKKQTRKIKPILCWAAVLSPSALLFFVNFFVKAP
jgi:hypothetical protein